MRIAGFEMSLTDYNGLTGSIGFEGNDGKIHGRVYVSESFAQRILELVAEEFQQNMAGIGQVGIQELVRDSLAFTKRERTPVQLDILSD